jgi:transcriptional regulator CBF1
MAPGDPIAAKRKRGVVDLGPSRPSPALRGASAVSSAASLAASAAAAAQEAAVPMDSYDEATIGQLLANSNGELQNGGQSATETAQAALTHYQVPPSFEALPTGGTDPNNPFSMDLIDQLKDAGAASHTPQHANSQSSQNPKPVVGSEEWHRIRRDNHKEGSYPLHARSMRTNEE